MKKILVILLILALIIVGTSLFTVGPKEYVAVREFGRIVRIIDTPGLYLKTPFIQSTQRVSAATILYDIPASDVITKDKKSMISDNFVLWRVTDPTLYIQTLSAIDARAEERIEAAVYNSLKKIISSMTQEEIIAARGEKLNSLVTEDANNDIKIYGIEILSSQIKALDLPDDNKEAVFSRMISERENIAAGYTAEGNAEAQKIRNDTDKQVSIMLAEAEKQAAQTVGEGEAEYMRILQEAYNSPEKAEFYNFIRSLDALKLSLQGGNKTLILDKDSALAQLLYGIMD
jgi:membrane protease subunit HflC